MNTNSITGWDDEQIEKYSDVGSTSNSINLVFQKALWLLCRKNIAAV